MSNLELKVETYIIIIGKWLGALMFLVKELVCLRYNGAFNTTTH